MTTTDHLRIVGDAFAPRSGSRSLTLASSAVLVLSMISGCQQSANSGAFLTVGCDANCQREAFTRVAETLADQRSQAEGHIDEPSPADVIRSAVKSKRLEAIGTTVEDFVGIASQGTGHLSPPLLLQSTPTHFFWLHGIYLHDTHYIFALRHGDNAVSILTEDQFLTLSLTAAWRFAAPLTSRVSSKSGDAELTITPAVCDLGLLEPGSAGNGIVTLTNTGRIPVALPEPTTSCGCTMASFSRTERKLPPGESIDLNIGLKARHKTSFKETIHLQLDGQGFEPVSISVVGCQLPVAAISKTELQAGPAWHGEVAQADFRLTQSWADRCEIRSVESSVPGAKFAIEALESKQKSGPLAFRVQGEWDTARLTAGTIRGVVTVTTTSPWMPEIKLPVVLTVRPNLRLSSEAVSFGEVPVGMTSERVELALVGDLQSIKGIKAINVPPELTIHVGEPQADGVPVTASWKPDRPNSLRHVLLFVIDTPSGPHNVRCVCTGRAVERSKDNAVRTDDGVHD